MTAPLIERLQAIAASRPPARRPVARRRYRSLFLSDLHLGATGCQAERVLDFLDRHEAERIYLVGDVFDTWRAAGPVWSPAHDAILQLLMGRLREGSRIIYIPGNHDDFFRRHYGTYFERIEVLEQTFHEAADGRRYLVLHGDCCDLVVQHARWLSQLGSQLCGLARGLSAGVNRARRRLGLGEGNLIERILIGALSLNRLGDRYEQRLVALGRAARVEGVICGHFHQPALHDRFGLVYANCGDWLENCTALAEDHDGSLHLIRWKRPYHAPAAESAPEAEETPTLAT
ncbi:MAG: metallophosphoesterase family protein [Amaricoccus sp.]